MTLVMYFPDLPKEISINVKKENLAEYAWGVDIDVDDDPATGSSMRKAGLDSSLSLFHFSKGGESLTGPIEQVMSEDANVWRSNGIGMMISDSASFIVDYDEHKITLSGIVPAFNKDSRLYFRTGNTTTVDTSCD